MQPENTQQRADNSLARQNTHPHGKQINRPKFERGRNNRQPENHPAPPYGLPTSRAPAKNAKAVASRALTPNRPGFAKVSTDKRQPENECTRFQAASYPHPKHNKQQSIANTPTITPCYKASMFQHTAS